MRNRGGSAARAFACQALARVVLPSSIDLERKVGCNSQTMAKDSDDKELPEERTVVDRGLSELLMNIKPEDLPTEEAKSDPSTPWQGDAHGAGTRVLGKPKSEDVEINDDSLASNDWSLHGGHEEVTGLWERSWESDQRSEEATGVHRDFVSEETRSRPHLPKAWLVMTQGPLVGERFEIPEGESRIGRATHCDWVIEASSISRKHATLELLNDGCWIRDEGANNGTFVDGERIRRRRLTQGKVVRLGEIELRFESDDPLFASREETSRKVAMTRRHDVGFRRWWGRPNSARWTGLLVGLFVLTGSIWGGFWLMRYQGDAKRERVEIAHDYYRSGVTAFLARDWDGARENFVLLQAYDPKHNRAEVYRRAIERERKVESALEEIRAARDRGDLAHGMALLRELPDSVLFEQDVGGLRRALDAEIDSRIDRSRADAQAGKWRSVEESAGILLAARPNDGFLMALRSHARSLAPPSSKTNDRTANQASSTRSAAGRAEHERGSARELYAEGDLDAALDFVRLNPDPDLAENLRRFASCRKQMEAEPSAETAEALVRVLEQCAALDAALSGERPSVYGRALGKRHSQALYVLGLNALSREDPQKAYTFFRRANEIAPHTSAKLQLESLARRAETMWLRGRELARKLPREAEKLFREALGLVTPQSELAVSLRRALDDITPKRK